MSPFQHGEVYVLDDGAETISTLAHERFTSGNSQEALTIPRVGSIRASSTKSGAGILVVPFRSSLTLPMRLQVVLDSADDCDVSIVEIGGTVGDIEFPLSKQSVRFNTIEKGNCIYAHVTLVPHIKTVGEVKTTTQHSVKELRQIGISPDILLCRCENELERSVKEKISLFGNVGVDCVFSAVDVPTIYQLPIALHQEGLDDRISELLNIWSRPASLEEWTAIANGILNPSTQVTIAIVGKYVDLVYSYKSLHEALLHGGYPTKRKSTLSTLTARASNRSMMPPRHSLKRRHSDSWRLRASWSRG